MVSRRNGCNLRNFYGGSTTGLKVSGVTNYSMSVIKIMMRSVSIQFGYG